MSKKRERKTCFGAGTRKGKRERRVKTRERGFTIREELGGSRERRRHAREGREREEAAHAGVATRFPSRPPPTSCVPNSCVQAKNPMSVEF